VIDHHGGQLGVMTPKDAIALAKEQDADLVEIVPNAKPPV
jgi:translation initiation factor IF-3